MALPRFTRALEAHKEELGYNQFWRYTKASRLPRVITWLAERPELARALADDAAALATERATSVAGEGSAAALA